jgi:hypothetical protein
MKRFSERSIARNFLNEIADSKISLGTAFISDDDTVKGQSHSELDPDNDGYITHEDLFGHFDVDNDGFVTTDEYVDHIQYHADNPETLDHYRDDVPCNTSYNTCRTHYDNDDEVLRRCISNTGATCMQSGIQALIDVLTAMKKSGMI